MTAWLYSKATDHRQESILTQAMATTDNSVSQNTVAEIIADWPDEPTDIAKPIIDRYGLPDEATESRLIWCDAGPWKRTELFRDGVPHDIQKEDTDYLRLVIDYQVPPELVNAITELEFDGNGYLAISVTPA